MGKRVEPVVQFLRASSDAGIGARRSDATDSAAGQRLFAYTPEAAERIWQASQGKPFVIQKFCVQLVNLTIEKQHRKIVTTDVETIRHEVLHDTTPTAASMASSGGAYVDQQ
jgi:hypothetical protein